MSRLRGRLTASTNLGSTGRVASDVCNHPRHTAGSPR